MVLPFSESYLLCHEWVLEHLTEPNSRLMARINHVYYVNHILGLKTALVEKYDYSSGTSSRSTKLIHGGVRYLQKAVFNLDYGQVK